MNAGQRLAAAAEVVATGGPRRRCTPWQSRAARPGHPGAGVQALQACPDVDRSIGRAFLQRIKPSEFCVAMSVMSGLPARLINAVDGVGGGKHGIDHYLPGAALLLQSCLQAACDCEVRAETPCNCPLPCARLTAARWPNESWCGCASMVAVPCCQVRGGSEPMPGQTASLEFASLRGSSTCGALHMYSPIQAHVGGPCWCMMVCWPAVPALVVYVAACPLPGLLQWPVSTVLGSLARESCHLFCITQCIFYLW